MDLNNLEEFKASAWDPILHNAAFAAMFGAVVERYQPVSDDDLAEAEEELDES